MKMLRLKLIETLIINSGAVRHDLAALLFYVTCGALGMLIYVFAAAFFFAGLGGGAFLPT